MTDGWITFWGIFGGLLAGAGLSSGLSFLLWKWQHNQEVKEKDKNFQLIRHNLLTELIFELNENITDLEYLTRQDSIKFTEYIKNRLHSSCLLIKFENEYFKYFSFTPDNFMLYKTYVSYMVYIENMTLVIPTSIEEISRTLELLKLFQNSFKIINTPINKYNFLNDVSDISYFVLKKIWDLQKPHEEAPNEKEK